MRKKAKKKLKNIQKKIDTIRDKRCNAINALSGETACMENRGCIIYGRHYLTLFGDETRTIPGDTLITQLVIAFNVQQCSLTLERTQICPTSAALRRYRVNRLFGFSRPR